LGEGLMLVVEVYMGCEGCEWCEWRGGAKCKWLRRRRCGGRRTTGVSA
jgi:hypothetical protein